jgi:CheB methylesterase
VRDRTGCLGRRSYRVSTILRALPSDLAAAIIVLLHQDPDRVSTIVYILEQRSTMPVTVAVDAQQLESGVAAVIPPGRHLLVKPGAEIMLISSGAFPPSRPSADLLLATLATAAGKNAIAVVLSALDMTPQREPLRSTPPAASSSRPIRRPRISSPCHRPPSASPARSTTPSLWRASLSYSLRSRRRRPLRHSPTPGPSLAQHGATRCHLRSEF